MDDVALELSHNIYGDLTASSSSLDVNGRALTDISGATEAESTSLTTEYRFFSSDDYSLSARLGLNYLTSTTQLSFTDDRDEDRSETVSESGISTVLGLGVDFSFARAGYEYLWAYDDEDENIHSFFVGGHLEF